MTGTILALASSTRSGAIKAQDGSRLLFSAASVLGDFDALAVGQRVSFDVQRERSYTMAVRVFREPIRAPKPARTADSEPALRFQGFQQADNVRTYRFDDIRGGTAGSTPHAITVDLTLLLKHRIGVQDVPALCLHKLETELRQTPGATRHQLLDGDLTAFAASRAEALQRRRPKHPFVARRGAPPPSPSHVGRPPSK